MDRGTTATFHDPSLLCYTVAVVALTALSYRAMSALSMVWKGNFGKLRQWARSVLLQRASDLLLWDVPKKISHRQHRCCDVSLIVATLLQFSVGMSLTFAIQALLVRHEAYMVDAERDRLNMTAIIERLEIDKKVLEEENAKTIRENESLLARLEELNSNAADSDAHVKALNATLESTQAELHRLSALAARTADLESQLAALEQEQAVLQQTSIATEKQERTAIQRWKRAERAVEYLEEQIQRIEREAREERERHVEVVGRLERRRAVERELDGSSGRLKSSATSSAAGMARDGNGTNVVSHFVKDILQDNANLQVGIVELREMLQTSNEEVQHLRDQLMIHQPLEDHEDDDGKPMSTLNNELDFAPPRAISQELHVHHHYHAPDRTKEKAQLRKPKKKRTAIGRGLFTPPSGLQTPRSPLSHHPSQGVNSSTASAILSQTSMSIPFDSPQSSNRWSMQSTQTRSSTAFSSVPSSPQSMFRYPTIFDQAVNEVPADSSRPTSPESNVPSSPLYHSQHHKKVSNGSYRSFTAPVALHMKPPNMAPTVLSLDPMIGGSYDEALSTRPGLELESALGTHAPIQEEVEQDEEDGAATRKRDAPFDAQDYFVNARHPRGLRKSASHESLISVSGMDIHTLRERPSQLTVITGRGFSPRSPFGISAESGISAGTTPVLSAAVATARPSLPSRGLDSSSYNRSLLESLTDARSTTDTSSTSSTNGDESRATLGRRVGGWVWGKWGVSPMASTGNLRGKAAQSRPTPRLPGINQPGAIMGLRPPPKAPANVHALNLNEELLIESLQD
ncbi:MAG: hypothetical protein M1825_005053 [Sarcosagium campestre]|nr:MAG: hypothetical protein M1825_005053 [Sarcosagium campestre]